SYIDYAMSVIVSRALPDVRDGLKPVHRRIIYAMKELGLSPNKSHRKSARIVGDVLGKYHPHGDQSVYNAMVRMAQDFSIRYELVNGHGNFGSIDGDSPAAMRYTEAKMGQITTELLKDINKETVDFRANFDNTLKEPEVLPARYPNLLVNGTNGIAVGMATSIPPHNLGEVIDGVIKLIDEPEATVEDLIKIIKGPDFPTRASVLGLSKIKNAYRTGRGKVKVKSTARIEEMNRGKSKIIVSEIPYQVNKSRLLEEIANLVKNKKIDGITDLRDESDRNGIRIVIELRQDVNAEIILNKLYKHTKLKITYSIIMLALVNQEPKVMNLYEILSHYLEHQKEVETRRIKYDLDKAEKRAHILEGYKIALDNIDPIIKLIKNSKSTEEAKTELIKAYKLSDIQADAILNMRLSKLTGLEREKIDEEYTGLIEIIKELKKILSDESLLLGIIREDLLAVKEKYGDERKTKIEVGEDEINLGDLIEEKKVVITLTHDGYIKRIPIEIYQKQNRGGRGKTGLKTKESDSIINIITTSTHNELFFFTSHGKVYRKKAYMIKEGTRTSKGVNLINLLKLDLDEMVTEIIPINNFNEGYLVFSTKDGTVKKTEIVELDTNRTTGLIAINLKENDAVVNVRKTTGKDDILLISSEGKGIRFSEEDVRPMGRNATGVKGMDLPEGVEIVSMDVINEENKNDSLFIATENGYGKRTNLDQYRNQNRGGKGNITYRVNEKTGLVIGSTIVKDENDIMIINSEGIMIRIASEDVSVIGRNTSGVKIMRTDDDSTLISIAKIKKEKNEDLEDELDEENVEEVIEKALETEEN
ncbi:MAG TPA: DNA gyrase subunit A, partial [Clostridia bacterium]|nr:DNA gyrase subunit A [Clostridia bacterium]